MTTSELARLAGDGPAAHAWASGCERSGGDYTAWLADALDGDKHAAALLKALIAELGLDQVAERARLRAWATAMRRWRLRLRARRGVALAVLADRSLRCLT